MSKRFFYTEVGNEANQKIVNQENNIKFVNFEDNDYLLVADVNSSSLNIDELITKIINQDFNYFENLDLEFSIFLLDKTKNKIYLLRDSSGIKNLYYTLDNGALKTSTNVFSLLENSSVKEFSSIGVKQYLEMEFLLDPYTLFKNIFSVKRGELLVYSLDLGTFEKDSFITKLSNILELDGGIDSISKQLREKIIQAHEKKISSDNIIMLSGGIDSTVMSATLKKDLNVENLKAVTFDTEGADFSEVEYAKQVAKELDIEHTIVKVNPFDTKIDVFEEIDRTNFPYVGMILLNSIIEKSDFDKGANFFAGQDTRLHTPALNSVDTFYLKYLKFQPFNILIASVSRFLIKNMSLNKKYNKFIKRLSNYDNKAKYLFTTMFHYNYSSVVSNTTNLNVEYFNRLDKIPSDLRNLYNLIVEIAWDSQYTDDIAYMTNNFNNAGYLCSMPFYDQDLSHFSASIPMNFALKQSSGKSGFGDKKVNVNKYVLREAYKNELSEDLVFRDKAVSITNHIYLNTIMSKYVEDFFSNPKLEKSEIYEELNLHKLIKLALAKNKNWKISDYSEVVMIQNLIFLEIIARKYDIED